MNNLCYCSALHFAAFRKQYWLKHSFLLQHGWAGLNCSSLNVAGFCDITMDSNMFLQITIHIRIVWTEWETLTVFTHYIRLFNVNRMFFQYMGPFNAVTRHLLHIYSET